MNFQDFLCVVICIGSMILSIMSWISQKSETSPSKNVFEEVGFSRFIFIDLFITHIHFGSSQPPVFLKITAVASLIREMSAIIPTNLLKKGLDLFIRHF